MAMPTRSKQAVWCIGLLTAVCLIVLKQELSVTTTTTSPLDIVQKTTKTKKKKSATRIESPPKSLETILEDVQNERKAFIEKLRISYGNYLEPLFVDNATGLSLGYQWISSYNTTHQPSRKRFQRKLAIKTLQAMIAANNSNNNNNQEVTFVWSSGGHSVAAGHGNLYNQSYTVVMEQAVAPVLAKAGIRFVGRNYGMGSMSSGPEWAMCLESIMGLDADVVSWDFAMTDGGHSWKKVWYSIQSALHRNRPALVDLNLKSSSSGGSGGGNDDSDNNNNNNDDNYMANSWMVTPSMLESLGGVPTLVLKNAVWPHVKSVVPDMMGMKRQDIYQLPSHVQHLKCEDKLEKGLPTCDGNKFTLLNERICDSRGRVEWHPGWKRHAIMGNLLALFVIDNFVAALKTLKEEESKTTTTTTTAELLERRRTDERNEYSQFRSNLRVDSILGRLVDMGFADVTKGLPKKVLRLSNRLLGAKARVCRTALLPAQSRYLGHDMPNDAETAASAVHYTFRNYTRPGIESGQAMSLQQTTNGSNAMVLVKGDEGRRWEVDTEKCGHLISIDYKDFYFTNQNMGWSTLTVPNRVEKEMYLRSNTDKLKGVVMMCLSLCTMRQCANGDLRLDQVGKGLQIKVNGELATKAVAVGDLCFLLMPSNNGLEFGSENGTFRFEIRANRLSDDFVSHVRLSSLIVM